MIKLFNTLKVGEIFHFGDQAWRLLMKKNDTQYYGSRGTYDIHPHVAVITNSQKGGSSNGRSDKTQHGNS